jgi:DNA sulfur modification protein DndD
LILKKISITNFRAATDVIIPFCNDDPQKNVTVVRAENKTGKTTILNALLWGLFGENGLPNDYRIANLNKKKNETVEIEVAIDFKHTTRVSQLTGNETQKTAEYRLIRKNTEKIDNDGKYQRDYRKEDLHLFELRTGGSDDLGNPQDKLNYMLGSDVMHLFFTNGDATLNFIQSPNRRSLVKNAIKDMMAFDVVENTQNHLKDIGGDLLRDAQSSNKDFSLSEIAKLRLEKKDKLETADGELTELNDNLIKNEEEKNNATVDYENAFKHGNKEELLKDQNTDTGLRNSLLDKKKMIAQKHAEYLYSDKLSQYLLEQKYKTVIEINSRLIDDGFPKASAPYLKKVLSSKKCICGVNFKDNDKHYKHIEKLINEISEASPTLDRLRELDVTIKNKPIISDSEIINSLKSIYEKNHEYDNSIEDLNQRIVNRNDKINKIPDVNLQALKEKKEGFERAEKALENAITLKDIEVRSLGDELKDAEKEYERVSSAQGKKTLLNCRLSAVSDLKEILDGIFADMESVEIPKVSKYLNKFFLKMIATEEGQGDALSGAIIDNYEIQVIGPDDKYVNLDNALNGASLRSLTLSFVLSLTKVCEFEAPNIIDSPFGIMSPNEKLLVFETLQENSNQLVLFLTRSEINNIDNLLDKFVGSTTTMVNTSKSSELKNEPDADKNTILTCKCNYREECDQCAHISFGGNV